MKKRTMLYFGSFNPIHKGHIALAEYVLQCGLCDCVVLVVSPLNPLKNEDSLLPELTRFEMAEAACLKSGYPTQIMPSAVEFLLDKPSYTINTLRFLEENNGGEMQFSILMGADNIENFHKWKEADTILAGYDIYVYPRAGYSSDKYDGRVHFLADAPLFECSSTAIRNALRNGEDASEWLSKEVIDYIKAHNLFPNCSNETSQLKEEGRAHFRKNEWGNALNAFRKTTALNPDDTEALEYIKMIEEILAFRYKDIYNP